MTACTRMADFEDTEGQLDWKAYRAAQVANGETCYNCGDSIVWHNGARSMCSACQALLEDRSEVWHDDLVRCPKCGHTHDLRYGTSYNLFEDGEHSFMCEECEHDFEISTSVSYSFRSPARLEDEKADVKA